MTEETSRDVCEEEPKKNWSANQIRPETDISLAGKTGGRNANVNVTQTFLGKMTDTIHRQKSGRRRSITSNHTIAILLFSAIARTAKTPPNVRQFLLIHRANGEMHHEETIHISREQRIDERHTDGMENAEEKSISHLIARQHEILNDEGETDDAHDTEENRQAEHDCRPRR